MSCRTLGVAVAVSAMMGRSGWISSSIGRMRRYSGRKSCPHSEIQCASSTATNWILVCRSSSMVSSLARVSGAK